MERLRDSEARDGFAKDFTAIQTLWEFLTPHEALSAHAADSRWAVSAATEYSPRCGKRSWSHPIPPRHWT